MILFKITCKIVKRWATAACCLSDACADFCFVFQSIKLLTHTQKTNKPNPAYPLQHCFWTRAEFISTPGDLQSFSVWKSVISSPSFRWLILAVLSTQVTDPVKERRAEFLSSPCLSACPRVHQTIKSSKWTALCFCSDPEYLCVSWPVIRVLVFKVRSKTEDGYTHGSSWWDPRVVFHRSGEGSVNLTARTWSSERKPRCFI